MTRPPEGQHPLDPPDLGRHYADRAERALREAADPHDVGGRVMPEAERYLAAAQAIGYGLLAVGERLARIGYAANRIHSELEAMRPYLGSGVDFRDDVPPPEPEPAEPGPIIAERVLDDVPPPEPVPEGWTPTSGDSGAPRAPDDERWRCGSCQHDTRYAPGAGCRTPSDHGIPF